MNVLKTVICTVALAIGACVCAPDAHADIKDLLKGLANKAQGATETTTTTDNTTGSTATQGSSVLNKLASVGNALGLIPSRTVDAGYLAGSWAYASPAVAFKSDNLLAKAGGVAGAEKLKKEIEPYYKKAGLDKTTITCAADSTFTMQLSKIKLSGNFTTNPDGRTLTFNFKLGGKVPAGSLTTYVNAATSTQMDMTFDVTKLMELLKKVGSVSGMTSLQTMSKLLDNYDGVTLGFTFNKTK